MGMPRRYYSYPAEFRFLNVLSTGGAFLLAGAIALTLVNLLVALRYGKPRRAEPLGIADVRVETPSPPPEHNFPAPPVIDRDPYDYQLSEEEAHARTAPP